MGRRGFYGLISFRSEVNRKFSHVRLADFMAAKKLHAEDWDVRPINDRIIVSWEEVDKTLWGGTYPRIQLEYSAHLGIIHAVTCTYHKNRAKEDQAFNPAELRERVMEELDRAGVILDDARAPRVVFGRLRVRRRRAVVVAPTHCRRADGASFGGVREQEDE